MLRRIMKKPKLPNLLSLAPQPKARKPMNKLQAHANRLTHSAYDDQEEPTTKLSTAFVVVLALHVVAVGGIYAFHSIKAKRREADGTAGLAKVVTPAPAAPTLVRTPNTAPQAQTPPPNASTPVPSTAKTQLVAAPLKSEGGASRLPAPSGPSAVIPVQKAPVQNGSAPAGSQSAATVAAKPQPTSVTPVRAAVVVPTAPSAGASSGEAAPRTYTVMKGDNPVAIAKRMHVSYEDMLRINNIDDPKKLQIGQVLKMPAPKQNN